MISEHVILLTSWTKKFKYIIRCHSTLKIKTEYLKMIIKWYFFFSFFILIKPFKNNASIWQKKTKNIVVRTTKKIVFFCICRNVPVPVLRYLFCYVMVFFIKIDLFLKWQSYFDRNMHSYTVYRNIVFFYITC